MQVAVMLFLNIWCAIIVMANYDTINFTLEEVQPIILATSAIFGCNLSVLVQQTWLKNNKKTYL